MAARFSLQSCQRANKPGVIAGKHTNTISRDPRLSPLSLYGGGAPPLAADATVVERSHLHLHKGDGELVAFPVVPVDTLPERECHFRAERFEGDVLEKDGKCSTSEGAKNR